ncbi:hypothetical protein [Xanthomonas oryzae]|uniref:hypothetical protein n=1 Tax=Xanthomonas oryzae TaxID=347 RepID=UPI000DD52136|nr:hypothetical protein [Xanthomonas oryzae]MDI9070747.1 hypothetical protein [Xanthomonas oryzae pv. oryzae]MDI9081165.1 hypothetical protein [Xanthomonas oryzae pv. oryzae]MDI9102394.1 hypothetical protein [Xanthomonas oryzae pv. oryzae]MDI9911121.1 hypothetical protein [Xanthomonas oryzae pv. oryzae]RBA78452.1 hypothetical protein BRO09_06685 [Xanthomonas oryzae pv. oryzae]
MVALSATNSRSLYDWFGEDFDVASSVDFASFDPSASSAPVALLESMANTLFKRLYFHCVTNNRTFVPLWEDLQAARESCVE